MLVSHALKSVKGRLEACNIPTDTDCFSISGLQTYKTTQSVFSHFTSTLVSDISHQCWMQRTAEISYIAVEEQSAHGVPINRRNTCGWSIVCTPFVTHTKHVVNVEARNPETQTRDYHKPRPACLSITLFLQQYSFATTSSPASRALPGEEVTHQEWRG